MNHLDLVAVIVSECYEAIAFLVNILDFDLVADEPSLTNDGRSKRWVIVRPKGGGTGLLLTQADGQRQAGVVGE